MKIFNINHKRNFFFFFLLLILCISTYFLFHDYMSVQLNSAKLSVVNAEAWYTSLAKLLFNEGDKPAEWLIKSATIMAFWGSIDLCTNGVLSATAVTSGLILPPIAIAVWLGFVYLATADERTVADIISWYTMTDREAAVSDILKGVRAIEEQERLLAAAKNAEALVQEATEHLYFLQQICLVFDFFIAILGVISLVGMAYNLKMLRD